ncbi:histidinol dehydrogenase [Balneolaceae bacterium YR4-1]|uniref:Histidinol dehydrogenase n=1 Tax=Halalkalibaculum roseum TaxID=2709311 RepID=A0A6M1SUB4_9BACT|nr:histidinol dehydrogenase [Halalkalibaculum roseum]NGP75708.1 histidinol dehydrogenase [Halalkalibaculum roseum]
MKRYVYSELTEKEIAKLCKRPKMHFDDIFEVVNPIIDDVRSEGDKAVSRYTRKFDGAAPEPLTLSPEDEAPVLNDEIKEAIDTAFKNIYRFHKAQLPNAMEVETMPGVRCMRVTRPIERVGLYVPGGTAMLPSTLMMLGIPAALAGCREIVIATPPGKDNLVADELTYIAKKIGASVILQSGGAQAIAAMAFGTESVPKVNKIFGPGNQYVTAAKMQLQNSEAQVAIDMPAGPSEVLVIADDYAEPVYVAADLLSQAEHGSDSQVVLLATKGFDWDQCKQELDKQLEQLPRKKMAEKALNHSFSIEVESLEQAFNFSNRFAPEHLIIQCESAESHVDEIYSAGSVFLGKWSPESAGDYASGTNHTLPTYGYARMYSGVSVDSFCKYITMQHLSKEGLKNIASSVERLAQLEELEGHRRAVSLRLEE